MRKKGGGAEVREHERGEGAEGSRRRGQRGTGRG